MVYKIKFYAYLPKIKIYIVSLFRIKVGSEFFFQLSRIRNPREKKLDPHNYFNYLPWYIQEAGPW